MTKVSSQFFALPEEQLAWVGEWTSHYGFTLAVDSRPSTGQWQQLAGALELAAHDAVRSVVLLLSRNMERQKADALFLQRGDIVDGCLRPSNLGGETDVGNTLGIWRELIRGLKKRTKAGLVLVDPHTGARSPSKTIRYSQGVEEKVRHGLRLKAFAGWNLYEIG